MTALNEVCETFEKIEGTSSRLGKEAWLNQLKNNPATEPITRELFSIALDEFRHYGIRELPGATSNRLSTWESFVSMVQALESDARPSKAEVAEQLASYDPVVSKWLSRALLKDLQMGVSYGLVDKLWPKLIRTFDCFHALTAPEGVPLVPRWVEPKLDGVRAVAFVDPEKGRVTFMSRGGSTFAHCEALEKEILQYVHCKAAIEGELAVRNGVLGSVHKTLSVVACRVGEPDPALKADLKYFAFDFLLQVEWDNRFCEVLYPDRHDCAPFPVMGTPAARVVLTPRRYCSTPEALEQAYQHWLQAGYEGVMLKADKSKYTWGDSDAWWKYKPVLEGDFEVVADYEGQAKATKGKLGGVVVKVGDTTTDVGGGFSKPQRELYWHEKLIGKIVQVEYKGKTPDGKLREPVFVRVRDDKHV